MAEGDEADEVVRVGDTDEGEEEEKWLKHYSSLHHILLVGEGDFSFSTSLAQSFGSASYIVATSLDSYDDAVKKYKNAKSNFEILKKMGASLLHGVDATEMKLHSGLKMRKFDRIIYNFPHAGFHGKEDNIHLIEMHRSLVNGFLKNASGMLRPNGQIHVNHKTTAPFCNWDLKELASRNSLRLIECVAFHKEEYPGYKNKRGSGLSCDKPFPLGECSTFKFIFSPTAKVTEAVKILELPFRKHQKLAKAPTFMLRQPNSFGSTIPPSNLITFVNDSPRLKLPYGISNNLLEVPICASQQPSHHECGNPPSYHCADTSGIRGLNLPFERSSELWESPMCSSQQQKNIQYKPCPSNFRPLVTGFKDLRNCERMAHVYSSQQPNYLEYIHPASNSTPHMSGMSGLNERSRLLLETPICASRQPKYLEYRHAPMNFSPHMSGIRGGVGSSPTNGVFLECSRIFGGYFEYVVEALQSPAHNSSYFLNEAVRIGYERYVAGEPGRTLSGYVNVLEELCGFFSGRQLRLDKEMLAILKDGNTRMSRI